MSSPHVTLSLQLVNDIGCSLAVLPTYSIWLAYEYRKYKAPPISLTEYADEPMDAAEVVARIQAAKEERAAAYDAGFFADLKGVSPLLAQAGLATLAVSWGGMGLLRKYKFP